MTTLLSLILIILAIALVAKIIRVFELSTELQNDDPNAVTQQDNKLSSILFVLFGLAFFAFVVYQVVMFSDKLLPVAASEHGVRTDLLFKYNIYLIVS